MHTPTEKQAAAITNQATLLTPFALLQDMQVRAILHASEPPEYREHSAPWAGIGFTLNRQQYVVSISDITEILPVPTITPLPGTKSWAKGLSNVRGRLVPIVSLPEFLGLPTLSAQNTQRIMVIDQKQLVVGLIVDEVQGMLQFPSECFSEQAPATSSDTTEAVNYFIAGSYNLEKEYPVFSIDKLVRHSAFLMAANE